MLNNWRLYDSLLTNGTSTNGRENAIQNSVEAFVSGMSDDPAYQEDAIVDGEPLSILAARESKIACSIKAVPGADIHIGDTVDCLNERWLVTDLYVDKVGIINGEMWLCNDFLRFQNRSPSVITRHCVVDDGTYSKKSSDPAAFVMTNTYKIYLPIRSVVSLLITSAYTSTQIVASHSNVR